MELEADWLMKLEKEDQKYAEFYREKVRDIDIYCLYIDQKNQLKFGHKQNYHIHNHNIDIVLFFLQTRNNFILVYFFFDLRPNLSLCLNLRTTIAAAIRSIATAS